MFYIKKILNPPKSSKENKMSTLETDALPLEKGNVNQIHDTVKSEEVQRCNTNSSHTGIDEVSFNSENTTVNVNNVNQQVAVNFSHINGLQIGSTYNIMRYNNTDNVVERNELQTLKSKMKYKYPKTNTIDAMMKSQDEPNLDILNEISSHLGKGYKSFMRELGFSEGQISAKIIDNNMYGVKEVIYQLLLDWLRNADGEGTVGYLTTKLWNCGQRECVYRLKYIWKSRKEKNMEE